MSKHWKEKADKNKHIDFMSTSHIGGISLENSPYKRGKWVYFVKECSFTFQFVSLKQIEEMITYFEKKIHPSTQTYNNGLEHYWQKWYERIPKGLIKTNKRKKISKALNKAYKEFSK